MQLSGPLSDCSLTKSAVSVPTFFASQDKIGKQLLKSEGVKPEYWFAIALEKYQFEHLLYCHSDHIVMQSGSVVCVPGTVVSMSPGDELRTDERT